MFKNPLWLKLFSIFGLGILLCIPLSMVGSTIMARAQTRDSVKQEIASTFAGSQTLAGPVLVMPYWQLGAPSGKENQRTWAMHVRYWLPQSLDIRGDVATEPRKRGIYTVQLFRAGLETTGYYEIKPEDIADNPEIRWGKPYLAMGISDIRGLSGNPVLKVNDQPVAVQPGAQLAAFDSGVHADLGTLAAGRLNFTVQMDVRGTDGLHFLPLGNETTVSLNSSWPNPSFVGRYLPDEHSIDARGFSARWKDSFVSNNMAALFAECADHGHCDAFRANSHGVRLIESVDIYQQSDRAQKYGFLFIVLTFAVFLMFELLKDLRVHPVQYSLVGLSLVLFFLLLTSLSEHIPFAQAYLAGTLACVGLLTFYVSFVLRSFWRGLGFATILGGLFGALYGLLQSEDYALLLGSVLLFVVLAVIMVITRNLDWYRFSAAPAPVPFPAPAAKTVV
jgi:inner membrane protein